MRVGMAALVLMALLSPEAVLAASMETFDGCQGTQDDPCVRSGSCEIQGAVWDQDVTIDRSDIFDTQGWPGVCDMVHVGLVQGDCEPPGAKTAVTVHLSQTTFSSIPLIVGPLSCAGDPAPALLSFDDPGSHGDVSVGSFSDVTYTVSNNGESEATSVAFSGLAGDWSVAGGTCGATVATAASCTVVVRFTPSSVGPSAEALLLDYDDGAGPATTVSKGVSAVGVQFEVPSLHAAGLWLVLAGLAVSGLHRLRHRPARA